MIKFHISHQHITSWKEEKKKNLKLGYDRKWYEISLSKEK
jgi:hypothetical protein